MYRPWGPPDDQRLQYSLEDDIIHTSDPPYDFYYLRDGAKERRTRKIKRGGCGPVSRLLGLFPQWVLPFDLSDLPYARDLLFDVLVLCPSLWFKYL